MRILVRGIGYPCLDFHIENLHQKQLAPHFEKRRVLEKDRPLGWGAALTGAKK